MSRTLSPGLLAALAAQHVSHVMLIELGFSGGTVYLTDAPFPVQWGPNTYTSAQGIGSIEPITETDTQAQGLTFTLAAVNPAQIAAALTEMPEAQNASVLLRLLCITDTGVHEDPAVWSGSFDVPLLQDGTNPVIRVTAEHQMIAWQQPSGRLWSHEQQQLQHPGDLFFQYAASLADAVVAWPRKEFFLR